MVRAVRMRFMPACVSSGSQSARIRESVMATVPPQLPPVIYGDRQRMIDDDDGMLVVVG